MNRRLCHARLNGVGCNPAFHLYSLLFLCHEDQNRKLDLYKSKIKWLVYQLGSLLGLNGTGSVRFKSTPS